MHINLRRYVFQSKESQNTISKQFQVAQKKLYEALTGKWYDPGHKLMKAEKFTKEAEIFSMAPSVDKDKGSKAETMEVDDKEPTKDKTRMTQLCQRSCPTKAAERSHSNMLYLSVLCTEH